MTTTKQATHTRSLCVGNPGRYSGEKHRPITDGNSTVALVRCSHDPDGDLAALFAAAPDMLQILAAIVEDVGYGGGGAKLCENFVSRAKFAIAKARGETH